MRKDADMRYLMLIRLDPTAAPAQGPDPAMAESMGALLEEMTKAGVLLDTAGLRPVEEGVRVRQTHGKQRVLDGPFSESKEVIGGYCLVQTRSQDEAVEWGSRFLRLHGPEWDIELEIRQLDDQA
ncbi:YciI family protein [Nocardia africana]|nr:YciI family protein [Nocardia africana]